MSIRDVMATDWYDLMAILGTDSKAAINNEVLPLEDFIGTLSL